MKAQHTPTVNLENLTCAIHCCNSPNNTDGATRTSGHILTILKRIYTDLKNPASFSFPTKLFRAAKLVIPQIKFKDVMEWLETQKSYTLHQRVRTKFRRRKVVTHRVRYQYQADLVDYSKLKTDNSGFTYVLTVIDCFSRFALALPIKRKNGVEVAAAFRKDFDLMGNPRKFHTDQGKEFYKSCERVIARVRCSSFFNFSRC